MGLLAAITAAVSLFAAPTPTVHMYGDSIFKGWGFGQYGHPSPLNQIDQIATIMAEGKVRFNRTTVQAPSLICAAVKAGKIRRNDIIVFEDAGPHMNSLTPNRDVQRVTAWLHRVAACAKQRKLVFTTMFDYRPAYGNSTYDEVLDGGMTINQVTRRVANRTKSGLLDWNSQMDAAHQILDPQGVHVVHPDGIHPTPWGNILIAASMVRQQRLPLRNLDRIVDELVLVEEEIALRGFNPRFTREQAAVWVAVLTRSRT